MDTNTLFGRLALSFGIGLLFGIERGWQERDDQDGTRTAGIRTFTLIGVLGGVWAAMTPVLGPATLAAAGVTMGAAFTLFYWREAVARNEYSVTSVIAALVDFALGAFAVLGSPAVAAAVAIAAVGVLTARQRMHQFVKTITWPELRSGVLLLAMSFIALPVLPHQTIDPWGAINPYDLWLMTVLIAVVSFIGYAAIRLFGQRRGVVLSSAAGAFVSSTTVTINNARLARAAGNNSAMLALGIAIAWIVSFLRMTAVAVVVNAEMIRPLALPVLAASAVLGVAVLYFLKTSDDGDAAASHVPENPLDLPFVLKFGALLATVTVATKIASTLFGEGGVLGLAGLSGFIDVDPITLSVSHLAGNAMTYNAAALAILLAAAANMVTKMVVALSLGGIRFGVKLVIAGVVALAVAGAVAIADGV